MNTLTLRRSHLPFWPVVTLAVIAIAAGLASGSVALISFGRHSFIGPISGSILDWRLRAEWGGPDAQP